MIGQYLSNINESATVSNLHNFFELNKAFVHFGLVWLPKNFAKFLDFLSHRILRHIHGALNIDKRNN
jgi:hypothetical protein